MVQGPLEVFSALREAIRFQSDLHLVPHLCAVVWKQLRLPRKYSPSASRPGHLGRDDNGRVEGPSLTWGSTQWDRRSEGDPCSEPSLLSQGAGGSVPFTKPTCCLNIRNVRRLHYLSQWLHLKGFAPVCFL